MPGPSWAIDAKRCITGQKLRQFVPDSACAKCYACKGRFCIGKVVDYNERRYHAWVNEPDWIELITEQIKLSVSIGDPYFRWFSSGDLQSAKMLQDIAKVARLTPSIQHWLPTQERSFVRDAGELPDNLIVRMSAAKIPGLVDPDFQSSTIAPKVVHGQWQQRVERSTTTRFYCRAPLQNNTCATCRACWDSSIKTIVYLQH
jgi:hypothetical protein